MALTRSDVADLERERGRPGRPTIGGWLETWEETAELRWPLDVVVYDRMRRTDGQARSILNAITLPIRSTTYRLAGDDVDDRVRLLVESELGLTPTGTGRRRRRREGISFDELLGNALLMLPFGHSPLEQVYRVGPPSAELAGAGLPPLVAHLRKLGPRLPRTLSGIDVADDGGLAGIRQQITRADGRVADVTIPVDRLVMFTHEREGADWTGTSIYRAAYKHWLIKDVLLRLGPLAVERNGMGVPVVYYGAGGDRDAALAIARSIRAGEDAGAALPDTMKLELTGVTGATRDELPLIKYHDESMGRAVLAMFLNLGHDNGARSLGDTFVDYFVMALGSVIANLEETITEHVIRDLVELNFGPDEPYPELIADEVTAEGTPTAEALKALVDAKLVTPDDRLEEVLRHRYGLPKADIGSRPAPAVDLPIGPGGPIPPAGTVLPGEAAGTDVVIEELERRLSLARAKVDALKAGAP